MQILRGYVLRPRMNSKGNSRHHSNRAKGNRKRNKWNLVLRNRRENAKHRNAQMTVRAASPESRATAPTVLRETG